MKNFFLEGDKFIGKSTLLQEMILAANVSVSGFYVKRRINEHGQIVGFELRAVKELLQEKPTMQPIEEHCFIQTVNGKRTRNINVFETFGIDILKEAKSTPTDVILLDEIGGIELISESFTKELLTVIQQPKKIVGVFKSESNYQKQKQHTAETLEVGQQRRRLRQEIIKHDGQILMLNKHNAQRIKDQFAHFLME